MAFLGGLLGNGLQAQAPGTASQPQGVGGLLGGFGDQFNKVRTENPEALLALAAGLMNGNIGQGVAGMADATAAFSQDKRRSALQQEGWNRDDARFAQTFGLQQEEFGLRKAELASEAQMRRSEANATADFLEKNGADPSLVGMARAGQGRAAFEMFQGVQKGQTPDLKEIYDENGLPQKGYFRGSEWVPVGGSKMPSNGITIGPDGQVQIGGPGKMTDSQRRNSQLTTVMEPELKIVEQTFGELTNPANQAGGMLGKAGNFVTTEGYQRGRGALSTIVQSYIYSTSGAAAPAGEVQATVDALLPSPGESPAVTQDKLNRIKTMTEAVRQSGGPRAEKPAPLDLGSMSDEDLKAIVDGQ